jgi:hypothetical protein
VLFWSKKTFTQSVKTDVQNRIINFRMLRLPDAMGYCLVLLILCLFVCCDEGKYLPTMFFGRKEKKKAMR